MPVRGGKGEEVRGRRGEKGREEVRGRRGEKAGLPHKAICGFVCTPPYVTEGISKLRIFLTYCKPS